LALVFGPRLTAHDREPITTTTLTAAVLGPTTSDHDSLAPHPDSSKTVIALIAALAATTLVLTNALRWRRLTIEKVRPATSWPERLQPRRGPPVLPA
jgi:hypothetical protein